MTWEERVYVCSSSGLFFSREPYYKGSTFFQVQGPGPDPIFETMPLIFF